MSFPLALALRIPARTRSTIKLRSSSATAPRTVNAILLAGVDVSICSEKEMKSIPRARNVSKALSKCETDLAPAGALMVLIGMGPWR
jgi:hypothetical protein